MEQQQLAPAWPPLHPVPPLAHCRFGAWLQATVIDSPLAGSPWCAWQPSVVQLTLADLLSERSRQDVSRFKKVLKTLCGGKKKGQVVLQPARGA